MGLTLTPLVPRTLAKRRERLVLGTYVAIGDSFSAGLPDDPPEARPWPALLTEHLRIGEASLRFENLATPGATSAEVESDQLAAAIARRPGLVTVVCGANDVLLTPRPDVAAFARRFNRILAAIRTSALRSLIVTATYPEASHLPLRERSRRRVEEGLAGVNEAIRAAAAEHGASCLELTGHHGSWNPANYAADGFHPSAGGHRIAADEFVALLEGDLKQSIRQERAR